MHFLDQVGQSKGFESHDRPQIGQLGSQILIHRGPSHDQDRRIAVLTQGAQPVEKSSAADERHAKVQDDRGRMFALCEAKTVFRRMRDVSNVPHTLQGQRKSPGERYLVINDEDGLCRRHDAHQKGTGSRGPVTPLLPRAPWILRDSRSS